MKQTQLTQHPPRMIAPMKHKMQALNILPIPQKMKPQLVQQEMPAPIVFEEPEQFFDNCAWVAGAKQFFALWLITFTWEEVEMCLRMMYACKNNKYLRSLVNDVCLFV